MKTITFLLLLPLLIAGPLSAAPLPLPEGPVELRQRTGEIIKVDFETRRLIIRNRLGEWSFTILPETKIRRGRVSSDRDHLVAGLRVTVRYPDDGLRVAKIVLIVDE